MGVAGSRFYLGKVYWLHYFAILTINLRLLAFTHLFPTFPTQNCLLRLSLKQY
jgi:hypothetical protein